MSRISSLAMVVLLVGFGAARGQWESGSDGSDGAFNPAVSTEVDLGLAASLCDCDGDSQIDDPCRWDCPSPVPGRGVYDAEQWVIVFKYTTVDVPSGITITFRNHPSNPPVAWLATGNVTINGTVNLNGENAFSTTNPPIIPYYSRPGPGGFQGGQCGHSGAGTSISFGLGPGSSPVASGGCNGGGQPASYGSAGSMACSGVTSGSIYGNAEISPLIGGSGGNLGDDPLLDTGGGAGGGAVLIAAPALISLGGSGFISARGGVPGGANSTFWGGGGSGGAIRLRAETVTMPSGSQLNALGGDVYYGPAGSGRIRVEATTFNNGGSVSGVTSFVSAPSAVFSATRPQLYVTAICGQSVPADPVAGITTTDVDLNSAGTCTVNIEGSGMPVGTVVGVRIIPARGGIVTANSAPMVDAGGGLRTTSASINIPGGRSEIQLRANW